MDPISSILVIIASLFLPPLGVAFISGCSVDFLINIGLTMLGYFPGLLHALYLEYVYYSRREDASNGVVNYDRAPGVYSEIIQRGGMPRLRVSDSEGGHIRLPDGPARSSTPAPTTAPTTTTTHYRDAAPSSSSPAPASSTTQQQTGVLPHPLAEQQTKSVAELKEEEARRHAQSGGSDSGSGAV
ncbi:hypothetical protein BZA70DRAFT_268706 [Myxozyma melibiosi]|uniref:Stress response RCI peptide n=1 Tax=Myxozyma melibiosi TaxID=54550 RepID=A0ABR1F1V8_9ASCO